jgi:GGDEF domain-containing protein
MTDTSFYEHGSKLLTTGAFEFVLDGALKRAVRSQSYLTLVMIEANREWEGVSVAADDGTVQDVARMIGKEIRDTDVIGLTKDGMLALVLLDADFDHSAKVIDRLVSRMEHHGFPHQLRIALGAACYPTDAVDASSLKRRATSRPIVNWRGRPPQDERFAANN